MKNYIRRHYKFLYVDGERLPVHFEVSLITPKGNTQKIEDLIIKDNAKPVITSQEVQSWFKNPFLEMNKDEADSLAQKLNIMRVTKPIDTLPIFQPMQNIFNALRILTDELSIGIKFMEDKIKDQDQALQEYNQDNIDLLQHLQIMQKETKLIKEKGFLAYSNKKIPFWHIDAVVIARHISSCGKFRGKNFSFIQANSKLTKKVKFILERANVISVEETSIAQAFKRFPNKQQMRNREKYAPN